MESQIKTEPYDDGYFEENKVNCVKQDNELLSENDGYYEEQKFQPSNQHLEESCSDENFEEYKIQPNEQIAARPHTNEDYVKEKNFKENNIKCGEIYWSKINTCYTYICSMCPKATFVHCKALTDHYKTCHPSFKMRKGHTLLENKTVTFKTAKIKRDEIHKIALEQLKNLPKSKKYTISKCEKCHKEFRSEMNLLEHLKIHNGKNPLVCIYCGKVFLELADLKTHQTIHSGKTPFTCKICRKPFSNYDKKQHHEKLHRQ